MVRYNLIKSMLKTKDALKIYFEIVRYIISLIFILDERYDKSFQVSISIDGITSDRKLEPVLTGESSHNR